ncbi:hypothetical protein [Kocuria sp.]|uniref:hypothetical protein n=1 Tax=Kocuria sp. TaxID=1871328 RepID=UPI0026E05436|nr:hypothetical protein [Kocuria sp.]MDO5619204.1 hypothetical protein [Kocuria sp.]
MRPHDLLTPDLAEAVDSALERAFRFAEVREFAGTDPYDGLLSPLAKHLKTRRPRQAWVQAHKRAGQWLRDLTDVPPVRMTKGMALFSHAAVLDNNPELANRLVDRILTERGAGPWGYEFDVQTRWAFYPAGSPNVVATTFALRAFQATGRLKEVSTEVEQWLEGQFHDGYFRYTTTSDRLVHNGSLLGAESLAMLGGDGGKIQSAINRTVAAQMPDGAWSYGVGPGLEWIDSFHTIYNLDSLWALETAGFDTGNARQEGLQFWAEHCLNRDGLPLYYANAEKASHDVHNVATTVGFLARAVNRGWAIPAPQPAVEHLLALQGDDGGFRSLGSGLPHMRWNQGHATLALAGWGNNNESAGSSR